MPFLKWPFKTGRKLKRWNRVNLSEMLLVTILIIITTTTTVIKNTETLIRTQGNPSKKTYPECADLPKLYVVIQMNLSVLWVKMLVLGNGGKKLSGDRRGAHRGFLFGLVHQQNQSRWARIEDCWIMYNAIIVYGDLTEILVWFLVESCTHG